MKSCSPHLSKEIYFLPATGNQVIDQTSYLEATIKLL